MISSIILRNKEVPCVGKVFSWLSAALFRRMVYGILIIRGTRSPGEVLDTLISSSQDWIGL